MDCSTTGGPSTARSGTFVSAGLRAALAGGAAMALVLGALGAADAATPRPHAKREQKKEPPPKPLDMPLIEVSISKQQLTLFEDGQPVAHAPVSTGMAGHLTPTGIFSVIGKEIFHRSNIYSGAPMPYMQRITWSGVAMHAGVLPGYPASHGCIRMPHEFAVRLYGLTRLGARVLVMPHEVPPVSFESAKLFTKTKPATDKTADATLPVPGAVHITPLHVVRTAESQTPSVMSDAVDAAAHALAGMAKPAQATEPPAAPPAAATTTAPADATEASKNESSTYSAAAGPSGEPATGTVVVKSVPVTTGQPIEVRKAFEPATAPSAGTQKFEPPATPAAQPTQSAPAAQPAEAAPLAPPVQPAQATPPAQPAQTAPAQTAQPATAPEAKPAPAATAAANEFYGPERPMRPGPITVFVSKKEGKLFVRKGFQPVFSWPVKIDHPELPLGTHLYTAVDANADGVSFRWQVVSVPVDPRRAEARASRDRRGHRVEKVAQPAVTLPVATPAEALERIDIPPVALTRISALMSKGASLIISDQGLGGETGIETDFIVLTR